MAKDRSEMHKELGDVVSIIGPGMRIVGDCFSDGTIRVEGEVEGAVKAGKSVVVGKDGTVKGDIATQDAIIAGSVNGSVMAESRIELQSTCRVEGDIRSRRVKLDEGGQVDGQLHMGASAVRSDGTRGSDRPDGGRAAGDASGSSEDKGTKDEKGQKDAAVAAGQKSADGGSGSEKS